ncbi:MAG: alpha-amylase [Candidatus Sumerlaeota bacterium]|nr:alpha-amylase [Candidatus Sumerlaeota bacterium]
MTLGKLIVHGLVKGGMGFARSSASKRAAIRRLDKQGGEEVVYLAVKASRRVSKINVAIGLVRVTSHRVLFARTKAGLTLFGSDDANISLGEIRAFHVEEIGIGRFRAPNLLVIDAKKRFEFIFSEAVQAGELLRELLDPADEVEVAAPREALPQAPLRVETLPSPLVCGHGGHILYRPDGGPLHGSAAVFLRLGVNNWGHVYGDSRMTLHNDGSWSLHFGVDSAAAQVSVAFHDGAGNWDNNSGRDWHFPVTRPIP